MSASKDIKRYSEQWGQLFNEFHANPEHEIRVPCATLREAEKLRLEFYKARAAQLYQDEVLIKDTTAKGNSLKSIENGLYYNLNKKEVRIEGTTVVFGYKEANRIAELLKSAIEDPANGISYGEGAESEQPNQ